MSLIPQSLLTIKKVAGQDDGEKKLVSNFNSYWDEESQTMVDYIVIGAGIIGLFTAIHLKMANPMAKILCLEKGILPRGASTRNAGFTCFGSLTEIIANIAQMGEVSAVAQVLDRWEGLKLLRTLLGDKEMDYEECGNYELVCDDLISSLEKIDEINRLLLPIFKENVFSIRNQDIDNLKFSSNHVKALVFNKFEGKLDSGKMMAALQNKALKMGVLIRYGSEALRPYINEYEFVTVPVKIHNEYNEYNKSYSMNFQAKVVSICVNAYTSTLLPECKIKPGRGQILVTEPLNIKPIPPCHMGKGYWYFRTVQDDRCLSTQHRVLIGGGRILNIQQETSIKLEITTDIVQPLKNILNNVILPNYNISNPKIEYKWSGLMGFSADHLPFIQCISEEESQIIVGFGCNGMGVARGAQCGKNVAKLMLDVNKSFKSNL